MQQIVARQSCILNSSSIEIMLQTQFDILNFHYIDAPI